ncbi:hypothetical protein [Microbacterium terrisoli]|uniref:hypothetical protein n=1 Tax=Microbacterium terrisoli TaxID=3242192 RepID=UPI0028061A64|nr:hypothetical protein [Microbacterium protaetiae]
MSSAPSRSSLLATALQSGADELISAAGGRDRVVVLIDGRSGAGKSTLAQLVQRGWPGGGLQVVALDSLYPGWDGLDAGTALACHRILEPYRRGHDATWPRWDWVNERAAEEHRVDADAPLLVEGSGILTPQTAPLADLRVWLEAPDEQRRRRALQRDGEGYRPHWDRWAAQEQRHLERDDPQRLATHVFTLP